MWFRSCIFKTSFPQELEHVSHLRHFPAAGPQPCHCLADRLEGTASGSGTEEGKSQSAALLQLVQCKYQLVFLCWSSTSTVIPLCCTEADEQEDRGAHVLRCCWSACQTGTPGTGVGSGHVVIQLPCFLHEKSVATLRLRSHDTSVPKCSCLLRLNYRRYINYHFHCLDAIGKDL